MDFRNTLAIVTKVVENPEIVYTPLVSEQVILIASPEHRLANLKELMENPDLVLACEE